MYTEILLSIIMYNLLIIETDSKNEYFDYKLPNLKSEYYKVPNYLYNIKYEIVNLFYIFQ